MYGSITTCQATYGVSLHSSSRLIFNYERLLQQEIVILFTKDLAKHDKT